jgi:hypothetical protein
MPIKCSVSVFFVDVDEGFCNECKNYEVTLTIRVVGATQYIIVVCIDGVVSGM